MTGSLELLRPEPHALEPVVGVRGIPTVIAFEHLGDGDHHVEGFGVIPVAAEGLAVQHFAQLQQLKFRQPVALFKGRQLRVSVADARRSRRVEGWRWLVIPGRQQPAETGPEERHGAEKDPP